MQISFQVPNSCFLAEFNQSPTAQEIIKRLPFDSKVALWGDEIYFETNIITSSFQPTLEVNIGDVAYWPEGKCICVFFGPTPLSKDAKPVPASAVVVIGKTITALTELRKIRAGDPIRVMSIEERGAHEISIHRERKLSQAEIDLLVQQLLSEQKSKTKS